ncbi:MAG: Hpt domain-containing protein [Planctomycetota bacterium]|nr:Hpt domain-containing protein [Planctomycetota bacterium]
MAPNERPSEPIRSSFSDDSEMVELIEFFVHEMPDRVLAVSEAWRDNRLEDLERLAHQIKGASGGFGFTQIGLAAERLEKSLRTEKDLGELAREVDALVDLCRRVTV